MMTACSSFLVWIIFASLSSFAVAQYLIEFVTRPLPTAVLLGQDLTLNCSATLERTPSPVQTLTSAPPALIYRWMYNGLPVETSLPKALLFQNHSMFVPRVTIQDLGLYECLVWPTGDTSATQGSGAVSVVLAYVDTFQIDPQSESVFEGNTTSVECVTGQSAPPALVYWEREGARFTDGTQAVVQFGSQSPGGAIQQTLKLEFVARVELGGAFRCVAMNPLSEEVMKSSVAHINIQAPQRIPYLVENLPSSLLVAEGSHFLLPCPIRGWPLPGISWYHDSVLVSAGDRRRTLSNGSLAFDQVLTTDEGSYACIGNNVLGSVATLSTNLTVAYLGITFKQQPSDQTVVAGQRVSLPCQPPDSYPEASVLWYKGLNQIHERDGAFAVTMEMTGDLVFTNVQMDDTGRYSCVAYNEFSAPQSRSSPGVMVVVQGSPQIVQPPSDVAVIKGDILTLACKVKGHPQPAIAWFKDEQLIIPTTRILIRDFGQELLIPDMNRLDEGHYRCTSTNVYGTTRTQLAFVDVIVPPETTSVFTDQTVAVGDSILLPCSFYGDPVPTVQWFRDGNVILTTPSSGYSSTTEGLFISAVVPGDEGTYQCVAQNDGGHKSQQAFVDVQIAPSFVAHPVNQTVKLSQSAILYCEARGDPIPSVSWTVNDSNVLPVGIDVSDDVSTLVIQSAELYHSGDYTCTARNTLGQIQKTGTLTVQEQAQVRNIEGLTTVNQGSDLDLHCKTKGTPSPTVTWTKNGQEITPSTDTRVVLLDGGLRLLMRYVESSDGGEYGCTAANPAGAQSRSVSVFIRQTPVAPFLDRVSPLSMTSLNVSWIPVRQAPQTGLLAYVVQYKHRAVPEFSLYRGDVSNDVTYVEVGGLRAGTEYMVRVAAKNAVGIGSYSRVLEGRTLESAPKEPRSLKLYSHNDSTLSVQWEAPEATRGEMKLYQVQHRQQFSSQEFEKTDIEPPTLPLQRFTLVGLRPYTTYVIRVRAANRQEGELLWGRFTGELVATTDMKAPGSAPPDVFLSVLSSSSIQVQWRMIPVLAQHGALQGYSIRHRLAVVSQPFVELRVSPETREATLTDLLPWRLYEVCVAGYNAAGVGVCSDIVAARTLAEVPSGAPGDVLVRALSSTQVQVLWRMLRISERRSEISGYLVVYGVVNTTDVLSKYVAGPGILQAEISDLTPWTIYHVKVQAFTTQVTDGFGPFSIEQRIRTLEDAPGLLTKVKVTPHARSLLLSWQPPSPPNGVIKAYVVYVSRVYETGDVSARDTKTVKRSVIEFKQNQPTPQMFELSGADTSLTVVNLDPGSAYMVAMAARTNVGIGEFINMTATTNVQGTEFAPRTSDSEEVTTELRPTLVQVPVTVKEMELEVDAPTTDPPTPAPLLSRNELIGVVVGSVLGCLLILVLLVLLLVTCCRKDSLGQNSYMYSDGTQSNSEATSQEEPQKTRRRPQYFNVQLPDDSSSQMDSVDRSGLDSQYETHRNSGAIQKVDQPRRASLPHRTQNVQHQAGKVPLHQSGQGVYTIPYPPLHAGFSNDSQPTDSVIPALGIGYENPGFHSENDLNQSPHRSRAHPDSAATHHPHDIKANLNVRHSKRMQRRAAAAIAAERNRESSVFHDLPDTDALINESVIVYNERTAL